MNVYPICNCCGEPCSTCDTPELDQAPMGLIDCTVRGCYDSTPGNGTGALDDATTYTFSMCEFCLDWLFEQFQAPPTVSDYLAAGIADEVWRPAKQRVAEDAWRAQKQQFLNEQARRCTARMKKK